MFRLILLDLLGLTILKNTKEDNLYYVFFSIILLLTVFNVNIDTQYIIGSIGIALGYGLDDRGSGVDSRRGLGIFLFTTASRTVLGPTQPPFQWVPGPLSLGVKRPGHEADHSPPSGVEVKNARNYTSTPPIRLHGVVLS
jgi:hypothetical protein